MTSGYSFRAILPIAVVAMAIAAVLPFDSGLRMVTAGATIPHMLLVGVMALAGGWMSQRARLNLGGSWRVGVAVALAAAAYVLVLDVVLFRPMVKEGVVALAHMPLIGRLCVFMARAFNENVIYRLFCFSALMLGLRRANGGRFGSLENVPLGMVLLAGLLAQLANIGINVVLVAGHTASVAELAYWAVRYVAPGVVWSWLYRRFGFLTTEIASVGGHLFLQPLYGLLI